MILLPKLDYFYQNGCGISNFLILNQKLYKLIRKYLYSRTFANILKHCNLICSNNFQYSIVYGLLNMETTERLSVGILYIVDGKVTFKYSTKKLSALKILMNDSEYIFFNKIVRNMGKNLQNSNSERINYLSRYSNNMIQFSPLQTIELKPERYNFDWVFKTYVYKNKNKSTTQTP